jgi:dTDP-4-amino-4,6-dideoxygalactose transaminase
MIPFLDMKAQIGPIRDELLNAVGGVLDSCQFVLGGEVSAFEGEFAQFCGANHAACVSSGTSALQLALLAAGVGPGDEVITVPMTFVATVAAVGYTGARAVLVDVDPVTYTMDPSKLEAAITPRTKVILPVHLYGQPADMDPILEIAKRHNLVVIEDAAQSHGAEYKGRRAGSMGAMGCFSFYPGKNLGACGEGGCVTTNNPEYDKLIRMMRDWGQSKKYHHDVIGFNYRMEGFQGAVLRVKLRRLEAWTEARRKNAKLYSELLAGIDGVTPPAERAGTRHVYHVYALLTSRREALRETLTKADIQHGMHYPIPVHLTKAYAHLGYRAGDFPVAERVAEEELSLPMFAELTGDQIREVANTIRNA